jgi:O-antigen/teichoic acid export membrane protein
MGRLLTVQEYGSLGALNSLLMILTVPSMTILFVVSKFISTYKAENNKLKMKFLYSFLLKKTTLFAIPIFLITALLSGQIASYLNMESNVTVIILGIGLFSTFYLQVIMGVIKGLQLFNHFALHLILFGLLKFLIAVILVLSGLKLLGAVSGISFMPLILAVIFSFILKKIFRDTNTINIRIDKKIFKYALYVFFANFFLFTMVFSDMILIPNFFDHHLSGQYASAGTLGRIVYYVPAVIVFALFPKVSLNFTEKKTTRILLFKAFSLTFLISFITSLIFFFYGEALIIKIYGERYFEAGQILKYLGFSLIPLSFLNIFINYELAKERFGFILVMFPFLILQIILIFIFHKTIFEVIFIIFSTSSLLLLTLLLIKLNLFKNLIHNFFHVMNVWSKR